MSARPLKVIVIGGGAAGFFGAIACAEAHPHTQVTLLEASRQLLTKVKISGGGRCNVTHHCFDPATLSQYYPRGSKALRGPFTRFQPQDTIQWFKAHDVALKTEADGRMFPTTDDSGTIVDCLIQSAKAAGVAIHTGTHITQVSRDQGGFTVQLKGGQTLHCDRLLLATGSNPQGYQLAHSLGHHIEAPVPSLFTFNVNDPRLHDLAGVAASEVRLRLKTATGEQFEQTGPLLITHWGFSGPAVLKLSAWGARALHESKYQATLTINWLPNSKPDTLRQQLLGVKAQLPRRTVASNCPFPIPRRLWERWVQHLGIPETTRWAELPNKTINQLMQELTQGTYTVKGKGVFKEEFVTCGGVSLKEVDFKTMESRCCPGLYFAGEVLDIDGVTGGFNFQSAWTTAWLAGQAIGQL